jgi:hypothetical protein
MNSPKTLVWHIHVMLVSSYSALNSVTESELFEDKGAQPLSQEREAGTLNNAVVGGQ